MRPETEFTPSRYAPLGPGGAEDPERFGRKAATLSRLIGLGMPVKPGFAVSVDCVARLAEEGADALGPGFQQALDRLEGGLLALRASPGRKEWGGRRRC